MKITRVIYIFVIAVLTGIFSGCSDWLDYTPKDKSTADQQFASREGFYGAVNGVYNRIISSTLYGSNLTYGMLDVMAKRYVAGTDVQSSYYKWANYNYTDTNFSLTLSNIWSEVYATILNINVILGYLDKQDGILSQDDVNLIKGDLLALRGFLHFDMLRLFGPVYSRNSEGKSIPYNNSEIVQAYEVLPAKSVIYDYLIPDLNEAENCLLEADPVLTEGVLSENNENGDNYMRYRQLRLNYYAVALLKARAYLWAGDMTNALTEARKITDDVKAKQFFPFVNSDKLLGNTYDPDRVFSSEILFGFYYSNRDYIYTTYFDGVNLVNSPSLLQPRATYIDKELYTTEGDYRRQSQWSTYGNMFNFVKYKAISYEDEIPFYAFFMPLMHVSEAYYIASEALLNTDLVKARYYLNEVLKARGIPELGESADANQVGTELKMEYMRETWGEGQIFYMFKRNYMNISGSYNGDNSSTVNASDERYVLPLPTSEQENR